MTDPVVSVSGLRVGLPDGGDRAHAVSGIDLAVGAGETVCLVGESGSGKSVVAQAIMGMLPRNLPMQAGDIALQGTPLPPQRDRAWDALRSARMAMIFQDAGASLDPIQRVGTQLAEIGRVHGLSRGTARARVAEVLRAVRLPDPDRIARSYPHQMSGGQAQRVVIAGALMLDPVLLIADEPTTALDVTTQAEILRLIADLQRDRGMAVLFITHDFGVVADIADRVVVMRAGEVVEAGPAAQVLRQPAHAYTRTLLDAAAAAPPRETAADAPDAILRAEGLSLTYRGGGLLSRREVPAVRDVSLALAPGRTLAIVGESGSGKSSLARCLLRLEDVDAGTLSFDGQDITRLDGAALRALRARIQVVLQDPMGALNPRQTVGDAIAEGPIIHGTPRAAALTRARELLELVGLPPQAMDRHPHEFSGGQRQRICIARALALDPDVLIADEAVSALDVSIQAQVLDLFADLQTRLGFAMVFITHDLRVAAAIADDVIVMQDGRVVEQGPAARVFADPAQPYTRALLDAAPGRALREAAGMTGYVLGRLLRAAVTLLIAVTLVFLFIRFSGDPAAALAPPDAPQEVIEQYRRAMGLDQPLWWQYVSYIGGLLRGEFGYSIHTGLPSAELFLARLPATLLLGGTALSIALLAGLPLGAFAALNRGRWIDRFAMGFSVFAFAMPNFLFGLAVILTGALVFQVYVGASADSFWDVLPPALTLGLASMGAFARFARSSLLETINAPFMVAAEARGVPRRRRLLRHAAPNAAIPLVTLVGLSLGGLIAGSVVTEQVFAWPGVGQLLVRSVATRDIATVQFIVLAIAATMVLANLLVDMLYLVIDPRIRAR